MYDYLIVGAGLFGSVFAHLAKRDGKKCLVIDKRPQLGGNLYCEEIEGINVHKYGAHIFHTDNKKVWDYVNSIVEFNRYTNSPVANYQGKLYNLPFNMNTFYQMWGVTTPEQAQAKIEEQRAEALAKMKAEGITEPRNLEEQALVLIGKDIYERLIKGYTEKQWGRKCTELPAFIIKRLPVRFVFDNNYFNNKYQGIPIGGYNKLIDGMLEGVDTLTGVDFFAPVKDSALLELLDRAQCDYSAQSTLQEVWQSVAHRLVYTGPIDQFFDYRFGNLEYRTVRFENEILRQPNYQGNAVINYTDAEVPYTRIIEHKHFEMFGPAVEKCPVTVVSHEYSTEWTPGMEPYYPVNDDKNGTLYQKYKALANEYNQAHLLQDKDSPSADPTRGRAIFGGRLAEYRYYDMAPLVERAFSVYSNYEDTTQSAPGI